MAGSKGYNTRAYVSNAPGAFYPIWASDFGAPAPSVPALTYEAGSGSLTTSTAHVEITWVTAEGVSLPSASTAVDVAAGSAAVRVVQPTVPTGQQSVIGWQIYSANTSTQADILQNTTGTTPAPVTIKTNEGNVTGFLVNTTSVLVTSYGSGSAAPIIDESGIQTALPSVAANSTVDYYAVVPNTGSQWKVQKSVDYMRSDGLAETEGIVLNHLDFIQPLYPGTDTDVTAGPASFFVMNGYLFQATTSGTTATKFIGFSNFNTTKGATTTDGSVVWTSYGKAGLVRFDFGNVSASAATPVAQAYEIFQQ